MLQFVLHRFGEKYSGQPLLLAVSKQSADIVKLFLNTWQQRLQVNYENCYTRIIYHSVETAFCMTMSAKTPHFSIRHDTRNLSPQGQVVDPGRLQQWQKGLMVDCDSICRLHVSLLLYFTADSPLAWILAELAPRCVLRTYNLCRVETTGVGRRLRRSRRAVITVFRRSCRSTVQQLQQLRIGRRRRMHRAVKQNSARSSATLTSEPSNSVFQRRGATNGDTTQHASL